MARPAKPEGTKWRRSNQLGAPIPAGGCREPAPALPETRKWSEATLTAWAALWASPVAVTWTRSPVEELTLQWASLREDLARLDGVEDGALIDPADLEEIMPKGRKGSADLRTGKTTEIRQILRELGASPAGRKQLGLVIVPDDEYYDAEDGKPTGRGTAGPPRGTASKRRERFEVIEGAG